ncbi:sulfite--cytochrome C oxidoreductase subunit B [Acidiphilium sp.]|uniref:sulfite--cytochrome C oxidoreductase subunit B n=1 Tax=Acidiphilium sp. TaxID=527 RepID=UPI00258B38F2|nr:sulfite--cytochrome C oxidoreductase subunit B [Acidiphilium sp.]
MFRIFLIAVTILATATLVWAEEPSRDPRPKIDWITKSLDLPSRGAMFHGSGATLLNRDCLICHSAMFVDEQPSLPVATWQAEVLKMKNVFGAPVDDKDVSDLVKALTERHGMPQDAAPAGDLGGGG